MLDIQLLRTQLDHVAARLATRGLQLDTLAFQALEDERKQLQTRTQELQARRNALSKQIGMLKGKGEDAAVMAEVAQLGDEFQGLRAGRRRCSSARNAFLATLPNLPQEDAGGRGRDRQRRGPALARRAAYDFEVRDHVDLGAPLGLDFETGAKPRLALRLPARSVAACTARSPSSCSTPTPGEHGYTECYTPYIVNGRRSTAPASAQVQGRPVLVLAAATRRAEQYLIPTAEITLTNSVREEVLALEALPIRLLTAHSPASAPRRAAVARRGGMIRQHQFGQGRDADRRAGEQQRGAGADGGHAEAILQKLEPALPGDHAVHRRHGLLGCEDPRPEVWLPAQNTYREISSCRTASPSRRAHAGPLQERAQGKNELSTRSTVRPAVGRTLGREVGEPPAGRRPDRDPREGAGALHGRRRASKPL